MSTRRKVIDGLRREEDKRFPEAVEHLVKIYGAAIVSSLFVGVVVYLYSLLPWTTWKDGVPHCRWYRQKCERHTLIGEIAHSSHPPVAALLPPPRTRATDNRDLFVVVHCFVQIFIYPLHGTFVVASYGPKPPVHVDPSLRGWGWSLALKGTYTGWMGTAVVKCGCSLAHIHSAYLSNITSKELNTASTSTDGLLLVLPVLLLGIDPRYYFLEHGTSYLFFVFEYLAVVTWMNSFIPDDDGGPVAARASLRRESVVARVILAPVDSEGKHESRVAAIAAAEAAKEKTKTEEDDTDPVKLFDNTVDLFGNIWLFLSKHARFLHSCSHAIVHLTSRAHLQFPPSSLAFTVQTTLRILPDSLSFASSSLSRGRLDKQDCEEQTSKRQKRCKVITLCHELTLRAM